MLSSSIFPGLYKARAAVAAWLRGQRQGAGKRRDPSCAVAAAGGGRGVSRGGGDQGCGGAPVGQGGAGGGGGARRGAHSACVATCARRGSALFAGMIDRSGPPPLARTLRSQYQRMLTACAPAAVPESRLDDGDEPAWLTAKFALGRVLQRMQAPQGTVASGITAEGEQPLVAALRVFQARWDRPCVCRSRALHCRRPPARRSCCSTATATSRRGSARRLS